VPDYIEVGVVGYQKNGALSYQLNGGIFADHVIINETETLSVKGELKSPEGIAVSFHAELTFNWDKDHETLDTNCTNEFKHYMQISNEDLLRPGNVVKRGWYKRNRRSNDYHYIFVSGLFTNHYPGYFTTCTRKLEILDLDYSIVPLNTEATVAENAEALGKYIRELYPEKNCQFILICHSKGGLDALEYCRLNMAEAKRMIHGIINIQCPFFGCPIVGILSARYDEVNITKLLGRVIDAVISSDHADDVIVELGYEIRRKYMSELLSGVPDGKITTLFAPIKFVTLASYADFRPRSYDVFKPHDLFGKISLRASNQIFQETGLHSDGLTTQPDARLPGSDVVLLPDAYHTSVIHVPGNKYHSGALIQALISLLFASGVSSPS